jgi:hypothetical protein
LLGEDRILIHYTAETSGQDGVVMICHDFEGHRLWSRPEWTCLLSLPGNCFVVNTPEGRPIVIDGDGHVMHRSGFLGVDQAVRHGEMLLFAGKNEIHATDYCLRRPHGIDWPGQSRCSIDCFVDGAIYWVEGNCLRRCALDSEPEDLCPLPRELIAVTMDKWERTTGNSALAGWYATSGRSKVKAFNRGDRPIGFNWRLAFDEDGGQFFLANAMGPHVILCLDLSGQARWCTYLCCGCCGGLPSALSNGHFVTSSGCGGILSWLDNKGQVLFQSVPHEGKGLAAAYTSDVQVLPNGRCLADGGPGIVAYGPRGDLEWIIQRNYVRYCCDPARQVLVGCYWRTNETKTRSVTCLEFSGGL